MSENNNEASWISLSDMMTGLMLVFLFISVVAISDVKKREEEKANIVKDYKNSKQEIYNDLNEAFSSKFDDWGMVLDDDLTIRFVDPEVLFARQSAELADKYKDTLDEFIPIYLDIVNKEKYKDKIKEIRIEGHTADWDDYMYTVKLSQDRANSVLFYIFSSEYFSSLDEYEQEKMRFWITANGLGRGRALDEDSRYVFDSHKDIDKRSRRVEFRLVTNSEALVDEMMVRYNK